MLQVPKYQYIYIYMYRYIHILICHMYTKSRAFLGRNRPHKNQRFNRSLRVFQDAFVEHEPQKGERLNLELLELTTIHHLNSCYSCHSYCLLQKKTSSSWGVIFLSWMATATCQEPLSQNSRSGWWIVDLTFTSVSVIKATTSTQEWSMFCQRQLSNDQGHLVICCI